MMASMESNAPGAARSSLELWGGVECTVNRIQDRFSDQCELNGHYQRPQDIELFAALGIKKIRYPVLWERVAPRSLEDCDWSLTDERLVLIRERKMEPILGLLHHGSGPSYTSLLDADFPLKFAKYASCVAKRYPWVTWYTPVNEPLTTARFSGLYGFWYPHCRDDHSFVRALVNELKGTVLAMEAIRRIQPNARLLQTEDLGRVTGTVPLTYQVEFENERRWLTFDFLLGRIDRSHSMYRYFTKAGGLRERDLAWFQEHSIPPDIIGINHYPLSNRFLDHRLELYPEKYHGGNGRDRYVDVGAVDSGQAEPPTPRDILTDVWERYRRPFAVTEAHIAGGREAQMRWLEEIWTASSQLRASGADVRAVTAWSLLGSFDWNSLCSVCAKFYESGVFDLRSPQPRPTALATMLKDYASKGRTSHPVLSRLGYWHEPERVLFAPSVKPLARPAPLLPPHPLLITGATGTLGRAFARICTRRGIDFQLASRQEMDIASEESVRACLRAMKPWAVINTAGYVRVDDAEREADRCHRENTIGPEVLARVCREFGLPLITYSSDLVFDGRRESPYLESDNVAPLNVYGQTKAQAEEKVLTANERALVVRTSSFFGPWDKYNFLHASLNALRSGQLIAAANDLTISPTYVPDLVHKTLDLLIDGLTGRVHLANQGEVTWYDWAVLCARRVDAPIDLVVPTPSAALRLSAARPKYTALASERIRIMPTFQEAFARYFEERE